MNNRRKYLRKWKRGLVKKKQWELWWQSKQRWRKELTGQKLCRVKDRDAEYHKAKHARMQDSVEVTTASANTRDCNGYTSSGKWKAIKRVVKALPKDPNKRAIVMRGVISRATSPERQTLQEQGVAAYVKSPEMKKRLSHVYTRRGATSIIDATAWGRGIKYRGAVYTSRNIAVWRGGTTLKNQFFKLVLIMCMS